MSRRMNFYLTKHDFQESHLTWVLIGINILIFLGFNLLYTLLSNGFSPNILISIFFSSFPSELSLDQYGFYLLAQNNLEIAQWRKIWSFFTSIFVHVDFLHLFFNMLALLVYGITAEKLFSKGEILVIYLSSGLIGSLFTFFGYLFFPPYFQIALGASGAIYGLMVAVFIKMPKNRFYLIFGTIFIVYRVFGSSINLAHLFGALGGLIFGSIFKKHEFVVIDNWIARLVNNRQIKTELKRQKNAYPKSQSSSYPRELMLLQDLRDDLIIEKTIPLEHFIRKFGLSRDEVIKRLVIWQKQFSFHLDGKLVILDDAASLVKEIDIVIDKWERKRS